MADSDPSEHLRDRLAGGYKRDPYLIQYLFVACLVIAWYNVIELVIHVFAAFRRYRGLYFWSLLVASIGILPYSAAFALKYFDLEDSNPLSGSILAVGSWAMVTGQALVLWSRLHLVLHNPTILRYALWMIIGTAITLHIPNSVLVLATNCGVQNPDVIKAYILVAKIQLAGFCVQEFILSALYIWQAIDLLKFASRDRNRQLIWQLVINLIIILMDVVLIITQYIDQYAFQIVLKPLVYSIKLKLEYAILSQLVDFAKSGLGGRSLGPPLEDIGPVINLTHFSAANSHVTTPSGTARSENIPGH